MGETLHSPLTLLQLPATSEKAGPHTSGALMFASLAQEPPADILV